MIFFKAGTGVALLFAITTPSHSQVLRVETGVVAGSAQTISAWGSVSAVGADGLPIGVSGALALYEGQWSTWYTINSAQFFEPEGVWEESNLSTTGYPPLCYSSGITAQTVYETRTVYGNNICVPPPPQQDPPETVICERPPGSDPATQPSEGGTDDCYHTPIIFNFGRGSYRLTGVSDGVPFDMNGDGVRRMTSWTDARNRQGFLSLDRNGNGRIDDGSELFGNHTPRADGSPATNGFDALATLDVNGDERLDSNDAVWAALRIWIDANHDGISQPAELFKLHDVDIVALSYDAIWTGRRDRNGNLFAYLAIGRTEDRYVPFYDVFLRSH